MSVADELAKLAQLRDQGVLSEEEFQAQKAAVLAQPPTIVPGPALSAVHGGVAAGTQMQSYVNKDGRTVYYRASQVPSQTASGVSNRGVYHLSAGRQYATVPNNFSTVGLVFGVIALFIFPLLFGILGMILGAVGNSKGEPRGPRAIWVSGVALVAGVIFSLVVYRSILL